MKKFLALILILCLLLPLAACSKQVASQASSDRVLVAYFSATGNTRRIAENIADIVGADTYEILPEEAYTSSDLEDNDHSGRIAHEQDGDVPPPAIAGSVENMNDYDVIFVGYPIWWGDAPMIMHTFLQSYDFSGKTIIPFCSSASVDVGNSATDLHSIASGTPNWLDGKRFSSSAARQTVVEWINELPITFTE